MASLTNLVLTDDNSTIGTLDASIGKQQDAINTEIETALTSAESDISTLQSYAPKLLLQSVGDGTAVTDSTDEAASISLTIPANTLAAGDTIEIIGFGTATATNSTDTLTIKLRAGGVAGPILAATVATDVADNDDFVVKATVGVDAIGASAEIHSVGESHLSTTPATAWTFLFDDTNLDSTAAITLDFTLDWSVASASNSALFKSARAIIWPTTE